MFRLLPSLLALLLLVACTKDHIWASDADVARAHYTAPGPSTITLFTSINTRSKSGAHAGLMINGNERVLYDPAGSWENAAAPERGDLHYGMTPSMLADYVDYQGSGVFQRTEQTVVVTPQVAAAAMQAAIAYGSANKAQCTEAIATVLRQVPGFQSLPMTWFPKKMSHAFAALPGVQTEVRTANDGNLRFTLPGEPPIPASSILPAN